MNPLPKSKQRTLLFAYQINHSLFTALNLVLIKPL